MNTVITNIQEKLAVNALAKKMNADLKKVAKMIGGSEHVEGKIDITYTGYSLPVYEAALKQVVGFDRYEHQILIRTKLTVRLILD